jgi:hypothetical protein
MSCHNPNKQNSTPAIAKSWRKMNRRNRNKANRNKTTTKNARAAPSAGLPSLGRHFYKDRLLHALLERDTKLYLDYVKKIVRHVSKNTAPARGWELSTITMCILAMSSTRAEETETETETTPGKKKPWTKHECYRICTEMERLMVRWHATMTAGLEQDAYDAITETTYAWIGAIGAIVVARAEAWLRVDFRVAYRHRRDIQQKIAAYTFRRMKRLT